MVGIASTGESVVWGTNGNLQLAMTGTSASFGEPDVQETHVDAAKLAVAGLHGCRVDAAGSGVSCWGSNAFGESGLPAGAPAKTAPVSVKDGAGTALSACTSVATASDHSCAVCGGVAYCWGRNDRGQLGRGGSVASAEVATPIDAPGVTFSSVAVLAGGGCAVDSTGLAWCWGDGPHGELGNGGQDRNLPTDIAAP